MSTASERVIDRLNQQFGDGTARLGESKDLIKHYHSVFLDIQSKVGKLFVYISINFMLILGVFTAASR